MDNRLLNDLEILSVKISRDEDPMDRWHIYEVLINEEDILSLSKHMKPERWYMHFWKDNEVMAVFQGKTFVFDHNIKETWQDSVNYGLSIGIPLEQLNFPIY